MADKFEQNVKEEVFGFLYGNQFELKKVGINLEDAEKPTLKLELYVLDKDEDLDILDTHEILDNFTNVEYQEVENFVVSSIIEGVRDEPEREDK